MPPKPSGELVTGEEASDETELGKRVCVLVEKSEVTGDPGFEEIMDSGDSGGGGGGLARQDEGWEDGAARSAASPSRRLLASKSCDSRSIASCEVARLRVFSS